MTARKSNKSYVHQGRFHPTLTIFFMKPTTEFQYFWKISAKMVSRSSNKSFWCQKIKTLLKKRGTKKLRSTLKNKGMWTDVFTISTSNYHTNFYPYRNHLKFLISIEICFSLSFIRALIWPGKGTFFCGHMRIWRGCHDI